MARKEKRILAVIVFVGVVINFIGIRWGLPSQKRNSLYFSDKKAIEKRVEAIKEYPVEEAWKGMGAYLVKHPEEEEKKLPRSHYNPIRSYHPDEYFVIKSLANMNPKKFDFNPHQYTVGGAYLYLIGVLIFLLSKLTIITLTTNLGFYFFHPEEFAKFYLVGRAITALYGVGIVWLTYLLARRIYKNTRPAILAGLFTIFTPLVLLNSHYMYVDIPGTFWVMAALYLAVKLRRTNFTTTFFLMGITCGLATGNKITFIVSLFIPLFSIFCKEQSKLCNYRRLKELLAVGAGFILAFFITNPYFFFTFPEPLIGLSQHTSTSFNPGFYLLSLRYGLGWPLLLLILLGIPFAFRRKVKFQVSLLFCWPLFFFLFVSLFAKHFARYILPSVPSLIILGVGFWAVPSKIKFINLSKKLFLTFVLISTLIYGLAYEKLLIYENIRTEVGEWIRENVSEGSSLGVTKSPWQFEMPPLDEERYNLVITGYDLPKVKEEKRSYFLISSFQCRGFPEKDRLPQNALDFRKSLFDSKSYHLYKKFKKNLSFLGLTFSQEKAPEDLHYLNPTILLFERIDLGD